MALDFYTKIMDFEEFLIYNYNLQVLLANKQLQEYYKYQYILVQHNLEFCKVTNKTEGSYKVPELLEAAYLEWWNSRKLDKIKAEIH